MENKVTARNPITEGCIWKGMLLFALPIMLGSLLQQLYNTADAVIVGRALGKAALASVGGSSARISNLLVNAFVALSSGASVIVAQHFGARDTQRVRRSICTAMLLSVVCGILLTVLGITSARQLLVWMQTTPETLDASASYLRIFFLGMVPTMLYNMGSGILRAMGDSKRPLYYLFVCVVANIGARPALCDRFPMGHRGRGCRDRPFAGRVRGTGRARPAAASRGAASALRP